MQHSNNIKVITKDNIELDQCHNSRARQLIKKKEAKIVTYNNEKYLQLNKYKENIKIEEEVS